MKFCEKLRLKRTQARMTQEELARRLGLAKRTVEGYESGRFYPRSREVYAQLSALFGVDKNWFLTEEEPSLDRPEDARGEAEEVLSRVKSLYAGGRMSESDKDALAKALMEAYWLAKKKNGEESHV